jgi:hypothetical protein
MIGRGFDFVCPGWDLGYLMTQAGSELAKARAGGGGDGGEKGGREGGREGGRVNIENAHSGTDLFMVSFI